MELTGAHFIAGKRSAAGAGTLEAFAPAQGKAVGPKFHEATAAEIDQAAAAARQAHESVARKDPKQLAALLEGIAQGILDLGDALLERASLESGLPLDRLTGERGRTVGQLRRFAELAKEGSWCDARINRALPDRKPLPRADIRRVLIPVGPVAVWSASNFPLAFSVAGGDTASAFAAGNPVIVKAHPGHPGTSELVAGVITKAVQDAGLPAGMFSMLQGASPEVSLALVRHPDVKAGTFTGSLQAGRALYNAAAARPEPIPFFAEMGSLNPVVLLPEALAANAEGIAKGLFGSVTLGVGQFCTCPGMVLAVGSPDVDRFAAALRAEFLGAAGGSMLTQSVHAGYERSVKNVAGLKGVAAVCAPGANTKPLGAQPVLFETDAEAVRKQPELLHEVFGPSTILVRCSSQAELLELAAVLEGSLTATVHATAGELSQQTTLLEILARKAGRLVLNGFPTGVEVCEAMHHSGPYPATTDVRFTSVGTAAIQRFARPVSYQSFPNQMLPPELQDGNPCNLWRTVEGELVRG